MKRIAVSLITGGILGVVCILGASGRAGGWAGNGLYLFALWYNRLLIGFTVGTTGELQQIHNPLKLVFRGGLLGLLISTAFYVSTGLQDIVAFLAGIVYGVIVEFVALWVTGRRNHAH